MVFLRSPTISLYVAWKALEVGNVVWRLKMQKSQATLCSRYSILRLLAEGM